MADRGSSGWPQRTLSAAWSGELSRPTWQIRLRVEEHRVLGDGLRGVVFC